MYRDLKKKAFKNLMNNKKIFNILIFSYLVLILLLNTAHGGGGAVRLLIYFMILGLNTADYNVILKLAAGKEAGIDDLKNVIFDWHYWAVFEKEWHPFCFVYIPFFIFSSVFYLFTKMFFMYGKIPL